MSSIQEAIQALKNGSFIIVSDDESRENEGDLVLAAEAATPEKIAFMLEHTGGVICVPMIEEHLNRLALPLMVDRNTDPNGTAFTVSVDKKEGVTTGISASDRAATIKHLANTKAQAADFTRPGHIFPLKYKEGGVLKRAGHTEASIDLLKLSNLAPVGVISEMMHGDGSMMRGEDLDRFSKEHAIPLVTVSDLIRYRRTKDSIVVKVSSAPLPTQFGLFQAHVYKSHLNDYEHLALVKGEIKQEDEILVRVHSECLTGDIFGSKRCDCGLQLHDALKLIEKNGSGICVYLRGHEGRGIGLGHKLRAYNLQDQGFDTVDANVQLGLPVDSREYGIGAEILSDLGVSKIALMTNNPAKYTGIEGFGLTITRRVPLQPLFPAECRTYMKTKKEKLGHLLEVN